MEKIAKILQNSQLPGSSAHAEMMPDGRSLRMFSSENEAVQSAVMLLMFPEKNNVRIVFIKRAEYDGVHSGQIAFPGGRTEKGDADFAGTALRETIEETGIALPVQIIGHLSDLYVPPSRYMIHPFVGLLNERPEYVPDKHEVKEIFDEDIAWFMLPESRSIHYFQIGGQKRPAPCFVSGKHVIWGATAMIFNEFLVLLHRNGYFKNR